MDQMRIYWLKRLNWYSDDALDFFIQDVQLIDPLIVNNAVPAKNLLERYYGSMRIREVSFNSLFYEAPRIWITRRKREYGVGIVNSLTADDIQYCFDEYFRSLTRNLNFGNCEPSVNIRYPDPFLLLDAGPLAISSQNVQNLLGSLIQVGNEVYQVSAYTVHRYQHYYSVIYLPEQNRSIIYDNNYGILQNHFSVYKLRQLYHYYRNCKDCYNIDYPDETVSLILLVKMERNDNNKKS
ncbi:unnamed protein product [Mytilus coruscus]|uniref:Uncharacterized protein n=1 Tax=Mytilus coruscus TaxID=42192 RepID=A0A6J8DDJ7_MYTCO|nr:unnamed protein product [Mytilus coruscus]